MRYLTLKEKRLKLGYSQQEVARAAGIAPTTYSRYEDGSIDIMNVSFGIVCRLVRFLGMEVEGFFLGEYDEVEGVGVVDGKLVYGIPAAEGIPMVLKSKRYDVLARAMYTSANHMKVLSGSRISVDSRLSSWPKTDKMRKGLVEEGIVEDRVFTLDYEFGSPSEAASVICGRHLVGTVMWRTEDGIKLGELMAK